MRLVKACPYDRGDALARHGSSRARPEDRPAPDFSVRLRRHGWRRQRV